MRSLIALVVALVALLAPVFVVRARPVSPLQAPPEAPGRIVYSAWIDTPEGEVPDGPGQGPQEIFSMRADGSDVVRLTNDEWGSDNPAWLPTGTIAYAKTGRGPIGQPAEQIHVMNADGSNDRLVAEKWDDWMLLHDMQTATMAPFVLARGQHATYYSSWSVEVFLGGDHSSLGPYEVRLTGDAGDLPEDASVPRPFTSVLEPFIVNKRHSPEEFPYASDIWMAEWTGAAEIRVTHLTDNDGFYDSDASPSPTGDLIAFQRDDHEGNLRIMTMRPDGSEVREIGAGVRPRWSPDGTQILYSSFPHVCDAQRRCAHQISIVDSDGSDAHVVGAGDNPQWGPACTIAGTPEDDEITGTDGRDFICAGPGDDEVSGGGGNDTIFGGQGGDRLVGGQGDDTLMGDVGRDRLLGGSGRDALGAADRVLDNDKTEGGDDVDVCYVDSRRQRTPHVCEVTRWIWRKSRCDPAVGGCRIAIPARRSWGVLGLNQCPLACRARPGTIDSPVQRTFPQVTMGIGAAGP